VSNCFKASAVANTPASFNAFWISASLSSIDRLNSTVIWMVTRVS